MVLRSGRHILPILLVLCVSGLVLGNEFKFEYNYTSPNSIKLRVDYDSFRIDGIKYGHIREYQPIQKYERYSDGFINIPDLVPCTLHEFSVIILFKNKHEIYNENILMISSDLVLQTESHENTIQVSMNDAYEACFPSLVVLIDRSRVILYPHTNLSTWSEIKNLSPCTNYNLEIYITINSVYHKIYDKTLTTKSIKFSEVVSINYDNATTTLKWTNFLKDCSMKYLIFITLENDQTDTEPIIHKSVMNEYKLDFLDGCSTYNITVTSENDHDLSINTYVEQGFKDPGPITNLKAELVNNTLLINWSQPIKNPACIDHYNVQIDKIQFDTKAHEHTLLDYNPSIIYNITVCQVPLGLEMCINYTFFPSKYEVIQNISNIDVNTNSLNNLTTWNVSDYEKHHNKYYGARLIYESLELMYHNSESAMINFSNLDPCETYRLKIKTYPELNWPKTTKPEWPDKPHPPEFISHTSNSVTMQTKYVNSQDECKIEMFGIFCRDDLKHIRRFGYDEEGRVTINNLKSNTGYHCSAFAKNGLNWSNRSATSMFYSNLLSSDKFVEMYVNSISSNFIEVSWITQINGSWFLSATKVGSNDEIPKRCFSVSYTFDTTVVLNPPYKFVNLEPNTNYTIRLDGADAQNENYSSEIFVTTGPDVPFQVTDLNISHLTSRSLTITWQLPCKLNGRIKSFVVKVIEDPYNLPINVWTIQYSSALKAIEIFNYTLNNIKPEHNYSISVAIKLVNFAGHLNESKIKYISSAEPANQNRFFSLVVIISIVCTFIVIFIILIGLAYWRYSKSSRKSNLESVYMELSPFFNPRKRPCDDLIRTKFKLVCDMDLTHLTKTIHNNQLLQNPIPHSFPYDFNRIILKPNQYCLTDYINASYINGHDNKRKYIATQHPTRDSVYNFWHMVIEEKCDRIVMLTELVDDCLECVQYYPKLNKTLRFNDVIIKNVDETKFGNFIKRSLFVLRDQKKRHVFHYQYNAWSNGDSPKYPLDLLEFIEISGTQTNKLPNPIIVHSSAGVGRTGTFIALDILFQNLLFGITPSISKTVKELRAQRCGMVETLAQYEFLYGAIESYYLTRVYKIKGWL